MPTPHQQINVRRTSLFAEMDHPHQQTTKEIQTDQNHSADHQNDDEDPSATPTTAIPPTILALNVPMIAENGMGQTAEAAGRIQYRRGTVIGGAGGGGGEKRAENKTAAAEGEGELEER